MTEAPDQPCRDCGGPLYLPHLVLAEWTIPPHADYVCAFCGRGYQWQGNPPRLAIILARVSDEETEADC